MRVECNGTTVSWIPSEAVTGLLKAAFSLALLHYDNPPPARIADRGALEDLRAGDGFRFANRIDAWAEFDGDQVVQHGQSGVGLMGSSTVRVGGVGVAFAAIPLPDLTREPEVGTGWVRFTQTCGGRAAFPCPRVVSGPPFLQLKSPTVWTTLELTLRADGSSDVTLTGASPFPRHWVYGQNGDLVLKAGVADFSKWLDQPSWRHTPWGSEDSPVVVSAAETALERELSTRLMRGGTKQKIYTLGAGEVLASQGSAGSSLYLVLDGILAVSVSGDTLGEVGPGAILGERAILEGGLRTATLAAVTPVRIAEAAADAINREVLQQLAHGHHREDQPSRSA
jgi:hypothetical protein